MHVRKRLSPNDNVGELIQSSNLIQMPTGQGLGGDETSLSLANQFKPIMSNY